MYRVRVMIEVGAAAAVDALLDLVESDATLWRDDDHALAWVEAFDDEKLGANKKANQMLQMLESAGIHISSRPSVEEIEDRDWQEAWKEHFHAERVSQHIIVAPSWEPCDPPAGVHVVRVDPGMSFGTGQHATTRSCIRILDRLSSATPGSTFADVGCGSGILSIAASFLGFDVRDVFDNDPLAVEIARGNLQSNGIDPSPVHQVDLEELRTPCSCEVVVANMLAVLLQKFRLPIVSLVAPGSKSRLVLGGMLEEQYAGIAHAMYVDGFEQCERIDLDGWSTGCFRRRVA